MYFFIVLIVCILIAFSPIYLKCITEISSMPVTLCGNYYFILELLLDIGTIT